MQYAKVKSVSKSVLARGPKLDEVVRRTMRIASDIVGSTLGPGGMPVLIERQEHGLPPMITKDGVTVFRNLGFDDATAQCIMEAARDAAVRTASEAGDGTTTATVLAEAIVRYASEFTARHPRHSPQRVVRQLESLFQKTIEPFVKSQSISAAGNQELLKAVAKISANGDSELAEKVLECFDLVGDDGNVTISESNGPSSYEVERIQGFPIGIGYEDCTGKFNTKFINDPANQRVVLDEPVFVIYHGRITEIQAMTGILESIGALWQHPQSQVFEDGEVLTVEDWKSRHNVVVVATGFSESVIGQLAMNMELSNTINVFPLVAPQTPIANSQHQFLEDLAAITGATVLDPLSRPLSTARIADLGYGTGLSSFEATRFRSTVTGHVNDDEILLRADQIRANIENAESLLDRDLMQERLGKLTGGIAKLKIIGSSNGELKEKRDRAEDAVCAVRGAIKHGCLPGGGWTMLALADLFSGSLDPVVREVLVPALLEPVGRLLLNCGFEKEEAKAVLDPVIAGIHAHSNPEDAIVYDAYEQRHVRAVVGGVLDSTPAVLEALRNSISIASLLGTLGGTVVYKRDADLERHEAKETASFIRDAESNPADERA